MSRLVLALCFSSLLLCSVGCRICGSPYDYCLSATVDRPEDFRCCGSLYRAGSVFSNGGHCACQTVIGDARYGGGGNYYNNAGNYGNTMSVPARQPGGSDSFGAPPRPQDGLPPRPGIQDIIDQSRQPSSIPVIPPGRPGVAPPSFFEPRPSEEGPTETIPFTPKDEVAPPLPPPFLPPVTLDDPPITLEELRRLDPTVQDVQIISVEDADTIFR